MRITIDATGKKLGRLATEIATALRGKTDPSFTPNKLTVDEVIVKNASQVVISPEKGDDLYQNYSGYPGGRRVEKRSSFLARRGMGEVIRKTVKGMLPKNSLMDRAINRLRVEE
jgi:large subunit ribosomal protein L13